MKLICKFLAGSHLYGTNIEGSDMDIRGVFLPDPEVIIGLKNERETIKVKEDKDTVYVSLKHFLIKTMDGSPNNTEWLFVRNFEIKTEEWDKILSIREEIISKKCVDKFLSYILNCIRSYKKINDVKDMTNAIRLLQEVRELSSTGSIQFPSKLCQILKAFRIGEYNHIANNLIYETIDYFDYIDEEIHSNAYYKNQMKESNFDLVNSVYMQIVKDHINGIG